MTTAALSTTPSIPIDPRISAIASGIAAAIPDAQVCLFGSRAKGTSRPDSDVDLLITVPDQWLAAHDRVRVLGDLWRQYSSHRLPLDLLLYTETEVSQRQQFRSAVTSLAYQEGILLNGDPQQAFRLRQHHRSTAPPGVRDRSRGCASGGVARTSAWSTTTGPAIHPHAPAAPRAD